MCDYFFFTIIIIIVAYKYCDDNTIATQADDESEINVTLHLSYSNFVELNITTNKRILIILIHINYNVTLNYCMPGVEAKYTLHANYKMKPLFSMIHYYHLFKNLALQSGSFSIN